MNCVIIERLELVNAQEFQARKTERIALALAHYVETTPPDKLDWIPSIGEQSCARSVMDQVSECIACNRMVCDLLGCEHCDDPIQITDAATARAALVKSAAEVASAIRVQTDESLTRNYVTQMMTMSGEILIDIPYRNMVYHGGQINQTQLLLGDREFHIEPASFK